MIGRKLAPVRNGQVAQSEHSHPFVPELQKIKHFSYESVRKYEHIILVAVVRLYVRFSNFLKYTYGELKTKIKDIRKKRNGNATEGTKQEPNKVLKMISEYKQRVRHIKHKIVEEEENK